MISRIKFSRQSVPFALLLLCLLSFGWLAPRMGFYWDDWSSIWFYHKLGPEGVMQSFSVDRPLLGGLFYLTTSLFGDSPLAWQIFGILARWLCCLAFWWFLRTLWPNKTMQTAWMALLFAVYPGFTQQYIAVTYSHVWLLYTISLVSLTLSLLAVRRPRRFWVLMPVSWLLAVYALFAVEYYFGLELLRVVLLWMVLGEVESNRKRRLSRTLLYWLPFLLLVLGFLGWRLFIHVTPRGEVGIFNLLQSDPLAGLIALAGTVIKDMLETGFGAWGTVFIPPDFNTLGSVYTGLFFGLILLGFALSWFYLSRLQPDDLNAAGALPITDPGAVKPGIRKWAWQAILLGGLALLLGGIPFWMTDLPITLQYPWDRFTLPMMFGASILLVGLLELIRGHTRLKVILVAGLIGMAVGYHLQNAYYYRQEWLQQKAYFWQLSWRVPGLQPGTTILTADWPFTYYSDFTMTAPLNWLYDPDNHTQNMSYLLYTLESRLGSWLKELREDVPIRQDYRGQLFEGSTSQALVVYYNPPSCLRVVDPETDRQIPKQPKSYQDLLPFSDPGLVILQPAAPAYPPESVFGGQPEPDWCYYFQQADLAQQLGDWQAAADAGDRAAQYLSGVDRNNAAEFLPFIEGYAMTGQWDKAREFSQQALEMTPVMRMPLCETWDRVDQRAARPDDPDGVIQSIRQKIGCSIP